jgi:hypothetical protein
MQARSTGFRAPGRRGRLTRVVAAGLLMGSGLACVVAGTGGGTGAAIFAATAVAATVGYRKLTGGCYASCSKDWHCDHESGLCKRDAREEPPRLVRKAVDAGVSPALDAGLPPLDAGG